MQLRSSYNFHETKDLQVKAGDKIAQIVVYPLIQPECEWSEEVTETDRGDKGFGSSDELSADMQDIKEQVLRVNSTDDWWSYADAYTKEKLDSGEYIRNPMKMDEGDPDYIKNPDYESEG